ncbi:bifunctional transcriptional activator/DNA repair enzyme AdaA [Cytobacillus firmus]|uniref:ADA regulatory protein n=1 Tax=Cytobacillus firmus TaxID=1399 RepID=A0A800MUM1_CYTFI|nr:bifunctional transcriptional activator/DNA repair enzyme AdaA [Cytobacillus firmus]KAF0822794.1 ADA regulatory protein [Cytobacillus firmus]
MAYEQIPEEYWTAIKDCDKSYDDLFLYGVKTTGIFCRPSCRSRVPHIGNVAIFKNADQAMAENFRPCKRCRPEGLSLPAEEWVKQITGWIDQHYSSPITLQQLGDLFHGSPYHLQRVFKRVTGKSPTEYIQDIRLEKAIYLLEAGDQSVADVGASAGFPSTPYFISLFKKKLGTTPAAYRNKTGRKKNEH